jgi:co-chaperonin GroES (HSP10)
MSTITPTPGNVVIEAKGQAEKTAGGLHIPEGYRGIEFYVLAVHEDAIVVGPGALCAPGDRVLINQKNSVLVEIDGRKIMVLPSADVLAVIA